MAENPLDTPLTRLLKIRTPCSSSTGRFGPLARRLLQGRYAKRRVRLFYALKGIWTLKRAARGGLSYRDVFQAGRSVAGVEAVEPAAAIVERFHAHASAGTR